jgi:RNA polymerase sigma factor (TIGR02999 family)
VDTADITELIAQVSRGDSGAFDRLFAKIYPDLRRLAHARVRQGPSGATLNTTALIHDLYLRMRQLDGLRLADRHHFYAYASRVMRSVLVDMARERLADKRGGGLLQVTLDTEVSDGEAAPETEVIEINDALNELGTVHARLAQVVELRFFAGLPMNEIAATLGISIRTVERDWEAARSFLYARMRA